MANTDNVSAWIYVASGEASLFDVQDGGDGVSYDPIPFGGYGTDTTVGQWVHLTPSTREGSVSHYIAIEAGDYDGNGGAANFYVDVVQATVPATATPEPGDVALLLTGGTCSAVFLRRKRIAQPHQIGAILDFKFPTDRSSRMSAARNPPLAIVIACLISFASAVVRAEYQTIYVANRLTYTITKVNHGA